MNANAPFNPDEWVVVSPNVAPARAEEIRILLECSDIPVRIAGPLVSKRWQNWFGSPGDVHVLVPAIHRERAEGLIGSDLLPISDDELTKAALAHKSESTFNPQPVSSQSAWLVILLIGIVGVFLFGLFR